MNIFNTKSLTTDFFETLYRENPDPWRFATSAYGSPAVMVII